MKTTKHVFTYRGKEYTISYLKRPFREGLEATVNIDGESFHVAELGYGEEAVIERIKAEIDRRRTPGQRRTRRKTEDASSE
jgi:hypothetical protein